MGILFSTGRGPYEPRGFHPQNQDVTGARDTTWEVEERDRPSGTWVDGGSAECRARTAMARDAPQRIDAASLTPSVGVSVCGTHESFPGRDLLGCTTSSGTSSGTTTAAAAPTAVRKGAPARSPPLDADDQHDVRDGHSKPPTSRRQITCFPDNGTRTPLEPERAGHVVGMRGGGIEGPGSGARPTGPFAAEHGAIWPRVRNDDTRPAPLLCDVQQGKSRRFGEGDRGSRVRSTLSLPASVEESSFSDRMASAFYDVQQTPQHPDPSRGWRRGEEGEKVETNPDS
ncbi:HisC-like protein [Marssonina coronariae]|uniref:HisC-like protein n=1 Tax=Diplocarpon coronariae TaxID=2795749 RepID=A0A218Z6K9_9HELO|nr:HisC-like protein [Marssonina coronariae]